MIPKISQFLNLTYTFYLQKWSVPCLEVWNRIPDRQNTHFYQDLHSHPVLQRCKKLFESISTLLQNCSLMFWQSAVTARWMTASCHFLSATALLWGGLVTVWAVSVYDRFIWKQWVCRMQFLPWFWFWHVTTSLLLKRTMTNILLLWFLHAKFICNHVFAQHLTGRQLFVLGTRCPCLVFIQYFSATP